METVERKKIVCAGCSHAYRWKPELAGKKAKCKCGKPVSFPKEDPNAAPAAVVEESGEMDLRPLAEEAPKQLPPATDGKCPQCKAALKQPDAVICTSCGMNLRTGKRLGTAVAVQSPGTQPRGGFNKGANANADGKKASATPLILGLVIGVMAALGGAAALAYFAPQISRQFGVYIAIGGAILASLALWWATYISTADNMALRLACRFIPFIGIAVVITRS
ncbi:MAG TPA: hypothetical protein VGN88_08000, partial [Phycisphaerae bacterium]